MWKIIQSSIWVIMVLVGSDIAYAQTPYKVDTNASKTSNNDLKYINIFLEALGDSDFHQTSMLSMDKRNEVLCKGTTYLQPTGVWILITRRDSGGEIVRIDFAANEQKGFKGEFLVSHDFDYFNKLSSREKFKLFRELDYKKLTSSKLEKTEFPSMIFQETGNTECLKFVDATLVKMYREPSGKVNGFIKLNKSNQCIYASFGEDLGDNPDLSPLIVYMAP